MLRKIRAFTLIELMIAISLITLISLGFVSVSIFTYFQVRSSDRRAKVQHEASLILEHMYKEVAQATGNEKLNGVNTVVVTGAVGGGTGVRIFTPGHEIAYRLRNNQIEYCPECKNVNCAACDPTWGQAPENTLSIRATNFTVFKPPNPTRGPGSDPADDLCLGDNYIEVEITCRWDPALASSLENPEVVMRSRIKMPSVSLN